MKLGHYKTLKQPKIYNNHVLITSTPKYGRWLGNTKIKRSIFHKTKTRIKIIKTSFI